MNGCFFFAKLIAQVGGNRDKVISWGLNYHWLYFFKPSVSKMEFSLRERLTYSFPRDRDTYLWKIINSIKRTKPPDVSCSNISQCEFSYNTFLLTIDFSFFFQFRLWAFIFFNCTFVCIRGDFPSQDGLGPVNCTLMDALLKGGWVVGAKRLNLLRRYMTSRSCQNSASCC